MAAGEGLPFGSVLSFEPQEQAEVDSVDPGGWRSKARGVVVGLGLVFGVGDSWLPQKMICWVDGQVAALVGGWRCWLFSHLELAQ